MELSEILNPEEVERRIRRTFQLRRLIKTLQKENVETISEMKRQGGKKVKRQKFKG